VIAQQGLVAIDYRNIRDDTSNPRVGGSNDQHMAAAVGNSPDSNSCGIDVGMLFRKADRILIVLDLCPRVDMLARRTRTFTQASVIEIEAGHALLDES